MATTVHWTLFLLLLALPLTAVVGAWLEGHGLTLISGLDIPSLIGTSYDAGATFASVHKWLGDAIMWLAGLRALAALYHHFVLKDDVLITMLPRWFSVGRAGTGR